MGIKGMGRTLALAAGLVLIGGVSTAHASLAQMGTSPTTSNLIVLGDPDDDNIGVSVAGGTITITDSGTGGIAPPGGNPCTPVDPNTVTCPQSPPGAGPLDVFLVVLGAANDRYVNQNLAVPISQLLGDAGDDYIESGPADDIVIGGNNDDTLRAGPGDDTLLSDAGTDEMNGGPGSDVADYSNDPSGVQVKLDGVRNDGTTGADNVLGVERVNGSAFNDLLRGDRGTNEFFGDDGDDLIAGGRGGDELLGGNGDDHLTGGGSRDRSVDRLDCGPGIDVGLSGGTDLVEAGCERSGARVVSDSAKLDADGDVTLRVSCPAEEGATCRGKLILLINGKRRSAGGRFKVGAGKTGNGSLALGGAGQTALRKAGGSLIVNVRARTNEPGGTSTSETRVLLTG
jgi:Ca2+-binding RTX toxin-like protein